MKKRAQDQFFTLLELWQPVSLCLPETLTSSSYWLHTFISWPVTRCGWRLGQQRNENLFLSIHYGASSNEPWGSWNIAMLPCPDSKWYNVVPWWALQENMLEVFKVQLHHNLLRGLENIPVLSDRPQRMQKNLSAKYMELPLPVALMTCESACLSKEWQYDTIRWTTLTCAKKLTSSQLSLLHGTKQKE